MSNEEAIPLLTYFDIRGRAEVIRLILEEVAAPYRERRVQEQEWAAVKPTMPFGQMPLYQDGELLIPQSHAIYRYLARKYGLYGQDERERVRCDIIEEVFVEAQTCWVGSTGVRSSRSSAPSSSARGCPSCWHGWSVCWPRTRAGAASGWGVL